MTESDSVNIFTVDATEGGQKLLQCLLRRFDLPQGLLHRWIRTGQIRVNGGRAKPFIHVNAGDLIRLPPFAPAMIASAASQKSGESPLAKAPLAQRRSQPPRPLLPLPPVVYEDTHMLVFNKPSGLPVHTGTGHSDSLTTRLALHYGEDIFRPTPAHRLDKDTSGLLLVARSYASLRALQETLEEGKLGKEYLAWVQGLWPHEEPKLLHHLLIKRYTGSDERMHALPLTSEKTGQHIKSKGVDKDKEALCVVHCLGRRQGCSLMHIRLLTGRTHQIRVQLSAEGHPLLGDAKYGGPGGQPLRLHSLRTLLPHTEALTALSLQGQCHTALPPWEEWQAVTEIPDILTVDGA